MPRKAKVDWSDDEEVDKKTRKRGRKKTPKIEFEDEEEEVVIPKKKKAVVLEEEPAEEEEMEEIEEIEEIPKKEEDLQDFRLTEEACITCGACAENCPNGAMRIEEKNGERLLSLCGTILNRQKLVFCPECGATIGPEKYLDYIRARVAGQAPVADGGPVCEKCARKGKRIRKLPASNI